MFGFGNPNQQVTTAQPSGTNPFGVAPSQTGLTSFQPAGQNAPTTFAFGSGGMQRVQGNTNLVGMAKFGEAGTGGTAFGQPTTSNFSTPNQGFGFGQAAGVAGGFGQQPGAGMGAGAGTNTAFGGNAAFGFGMSMPSTQPQPQAQAQPGNFWSFKTSGTNMPAGGLFGAGVGMGQAAQRPSSIYATDVQGTVTAVAILSEGNIACGTLEGEVMIYSFQSQTPVVKCPCNGSVLCLARSPDGSLLLIGSSRGLHALKEGGSTLMDLDALEGCPVFSIQCCTAGSSNQPVHVFYSKAARNGTGYTLIDAQTAGGWGQVNTTSSKMIGYKICHATCGADGCFKKLSESTPQPCCGVFHASMTSGNYYSPTSFSILVPLYNQRKPYLFLKSSAQSRNATETIAEDTTKSGSISQGTTLDSPIVGCFTSGSKVVILTETKGLHIYETPGSRYNNVGGSPTPVIASAYKADEKLLFFTSGNSLAYQVASTTTNGQPERAIVLAGEGPISAFDYLKGGRFVLATGQGEALYNTGQTTQPCRLSVYEKKPTSSSATGLGASRVIFSDVQPLP